MNGQIDHSGILSIDIGGSFIKAALLNAEGEICSPFKRVPTPATAPVLEMITVLLRLASQFKGFDKISVGFPGYVKDGIVFTAPNLNNTTWKQIPLRDLLSDATDMPVRIVNDADMHAAGIAAGKGLEMLITLGTGLGSALVYNGFLLPHLELAHHPFKDGVTTDIYIGSRSFVKIGEAAWNARVEELLAVLQTVFNYDHLYIGGGNAQYINFDLADNITIVSNEQGIQGGARLWADSYAEKMVRGF